MKYQSLVEAVLMTAVKYLVRQLRPVLLHLLQLHPVLLHLRLLPPLEHLHRVPQHPPRPYPLAVLR